MKRFLFFFLWLWLCKAAALAMPLPAFYADAPDGNATIRATAGPSEIVITTTRRLAGAIHSLTWNGREFINSTDHGRQLQSAINLDCGTPVTGETFNPTEAGSCHDGAGNTSSSRLLRWNVGKDSLETQIQMAFWLRPGEKSGPNLAKNTAILSDHLLTKRVHIGYKNLPHVISYDVVFTIPRGEHHTFSCFEALTGYMPPEFSEFYRFHAPTGELKPVTTVDGERAQPVIFSVPGGSHAMGIFAPPQPLTPNMTGPTYGTFRFDWAKVVKWNCVYRLTNKTGIAPGDYPFRMFVIVGDLKTVRDSLDKLEHDFVQTR